MELEEKKEHILRLVPLGVDFFSACIEARCSREEMTILEEDEELQSELNFLRNQEKLRLTRKYRETAERAADVKMDYAALRTLLKDFFPSALSPGEEEDGTEKVTVYIPDNGRS